MVAFRPRPYKLKQSHLRYAVYRWILPRLGSEPLAVRNLSQKAWPRVAALTAPRDYTDTIESIDWHTNGDDDGSSVLDDYAAASRPVVLKGYGSSTPEVSWTFERLKREVGDISARIRVGNYASAAGDPDTVTMRVADFVDNLFGQSASAHTESLVDGMGPYLGNAQLPPIAEQMSRPDTFRDNGSTTFWLGADSRTPLHCHQFCDVLLCQLIGRRSVILVPPHQAPLVGFMPVNVNICTAAFDPFEPDQDQFPGSELVHGLRYELQPGDALLIPGFWFHAVRIAGPSICGSCFRDTMMPKSLGGGPISPWKRAAYRPGW